MEGVEITPTAIGFGLYCHKNRAEGIGTRARAA